MKHCLHDETLNMHTVVAALQKSIDAYARFFSIGEIDKSPILQWSFGASLFFFFLTFEGWIGSSLTTIETAARKTEICWPYFQGCGKLYFLQTLPDGYSQSIWYMGLYALIVAIVYAIWKREWAEAHLYLMILLVWKLFVMFVLSYAISGPYDYYHVAFTIALLFLPYKEYFLKLTFVVLYFLAGTTKFDDTWVLGTYFTTLQTGLPIFPTALTPLFTNLVIGMQVVGTWFLLSRKTILQRSALWFFIIFHLYSGVLVYYHYPSISLPFLLILFGPMYQHTPIPFTKKAFAGWLFIIALFVFQSPPFFIPGDRRLTLEGNRYGMFMFEANHQCISTERIYRTPHKPIVPSTTINVNCSGQTCLTGTRVYEEKGLEVSENRRETGASWNRCDPYVEWSRLHQQCSRDSSVQRIALTFDHSINGGPFYRIVDTADICSLSYLPFSHNDWILLPPAAKIVGYPIKDEYRY